MTWIHTVGMAVGTGTPHISVLGAWGSSQDWKTQSQASRRAEVTPLDLRVASSRTVELGKRAGHEDVGEGSGSPCPGPCRPSQGPKRPPGRGRPCGFPAGQRSPAVPPSGLTPDPCTATSAGAHVPPTNGVSASTVGAASQPRSALSPASTPAALVALAARLAQGMVGREVHTRSAQARLSSLNILHVRSVEFVDAEPGWGAGGRGRRPAEGSSAAREDVRSLDHERVAIREEESTGLHSDGTGRQARHCLVLPSVPSRRAKFITYKKRAQLRL